MNDGAVIERTDWNILHVVARAKPCSDHVKQALLPHHYIIDWLVAMETAAKDAED